MTNRILNGLLLWSVCEIGLIMAIGIAVGIAGSITTLIHLYAILTHF